MKQKGFILITTLLILSVLTLVVMSSFESSVTNLRMDSRQHNENRLFWQAEMALQKATELLKHNPDIASTKELTPDLDKKDVYWWKQNAYKFTKGEGAKYYMIEQINRAPCVQSFYRVTAMVFDKVSLSKILLQETFAFPMKLSNECKGSIIPVKPGVQSWRSL